PPADGGQLDRAAHPAGVGDRLHDAHDPPLQRAEDLPPPQRLEVDVVAVPGGQLLVGPEAADGQVDAEAPRLHAEPAEVLHRVAGVGQLPVEDGPHALGTDHEVAVAEVAVDD